MPTVRLPASRRWWRPGSGFRVPSSGFRPWTLGVGWWVRGSGFRVPSSERRRSERQVRSEVRGPSAWCTGVGGGASGSGFRVPSSCASGGGRRRSGSAHAPLPNGEDGRGRGPGSEGRWWMRGGRAEVRVPNAHLPTFIRIMKGSGFRGLEFRPVGPQDPPSLSIFSVFPHTTIRSSHTLETACTYACTSARPPWPIRLARPMSRSRQGWHRIISRRTPRRRATRRARGSSRC